MEHDQTAAVVSESDPDAACQYAIVQTDDGPECTIFPRGVSGDDLVTRWVTADERSFFPLEDMC